jgi:hypothetical protein
MAEKFPQEVGWRKAEATINVGLEHNDFFIRRSWHYFTRLDPPFGDLPCSYAAFPL